MNNLFSYIITHRGFNTEREYNLKCIIKLIKKLQATHNIEIIVVEQDIKKQVDLDPDVNHVLAYNPGDFSRAWGLNVGSKIAKGNVLIFGDGDVFLTPDKFSKFLNKFNKEYLEYDVISPYKNRVRNIDKNDSIYFRDNLKLNKEYEGASGSGSSLMGGLCAIWKKSYNKSAGWDENFIGWGGEDNAYRDHLKASGFKLLSDDFTAYHLYHDTEQQKSTGYIHRKGQNQEYYFSVYRFKSKQHIEKNRAENNDIGNPNKYK